MPIKLGFDNLNDAQSKIMGCFAYYDGKAITVKNVWEDVDKAHKNLIYYASGIPLIGRAAFPAIEIEDPKFNCSDFNIGYANAHGVCVWFFRNPVKQYSQGLKYNQISAKCTNQQAAGIEFKHGKPIGEMLEGIYPDFKKAAKFLNAGEAQMMAFNKNFAMSRDKVHKDFILEYKGQHIGFTADLKSFNLLEQHEHLLEALKEAVG